MLGSDRSELALRRHNDESSLKDVLGILFVRKQTSGGTEDGQTVPIYEGGKGVFIVLEGKPAE